MWPSGPVAVATMILGRLRTGSGDGLGGRARARGPRRTSFPARVARRGTLGTDALLPRGEDPNHV